MRRIGAMIEEKLCFSGQRLQHGGLLEVFEPVQEDQIT